MNHDLTVTALQRLVGGKFSITGENITYDEGVEAPSRLEIEAEVEVVKKELLKKELEAEARKLATEALITERIEADPYLSAMAKIKAKIDSGEINENARKALRDEIEKTKEK